MVKIAQQMVSIKPVYSCFNVGFLTDSNKTQFQKSFHVQIFDEKLKFLTCR